MYVAIRDVTAKETGQPNLQAALRFLALQAVELEYSNKDMVLLPREDWQHLISLAEPENWLSLSKTYQEVGLKVCAFLMGNNFANPDQEGEIAWLVRAIKAAAGAGIGVVRVDAVLHGEREYQIPEAIKLASTALSAALTETEKLPVKLGIENHGFYGNEPRFLLGVIDKVGSSRLGITLDTGNFYWSGKPLKEVYRIIRELAPYACHTHIKNINYPENVRAENRPMGWEYERYVSPIPEGDVDHRIVVEILKEAGYDTDLTIEDESLGKFSKEERPSILQADARYLTSLLVD